MTHTTTRNAELRNKLDLRRREMQHDVRGRIRDGRTDRTIDVRDDLEHSDDDSQGTIELVLLGMRAAALTRVDEALVRLDAGKYGNCVECAGRITARRLRALPYAVRCRDCEARREQEQGSVRELAERRPSRLSELVGS